MIKEVLAIMGFIILYSVWLISPFAICICEENGYYTLGKVSTIIFVLGMVIVGVALLININL